MEAPKLLDGRLKVRHLMLVHTLMETGTVVGAAARLHISQPGVSRALLELEAILGVELFERGPRGLTPTMYGSAFVGHARSALAHLNLASTQIVELASATQGQVSVGAHLGGTAFHIPRAIQRLKRAYPLVSVTVRTGAFEELVASLRTGQLDLLVSRAEPTTVAAGLAREVLYEEPIDVVARSDHPAFGLQATTLADLFDYPWILPGDATMLRQQVEQEFARLNLPLPRNRVEVTTFLTVRRLLAETDSVTVLPRGMTVGDSTLRRLDIPVPFTQTVTLSVQESPPPSVPAQRFVEHLRVIAGQLSDGVTNLDGVGDPTRG